MRAKRLRAQGAKAKDVTPRKNASRKGAQKKAADFLPKILAMARHNGSLQQQWVRCGKTNCRCASGQLHGPYVYFFMSMSGHLTKSYVRRKDVPLVRAVIAERQRQAQAFRAEMNAARAFLRRMMSAAVGVRI